MATDPQERFTSARAERTHWRRGSRRRRTVHLRSRGEDDGRLTITVLSGGSPPLARRGPPTIKLAALLLRFTSARAERTGWRWRRACRPSVHLRSRGEDAGAAACATPVTGSPPLARRGHVVGEGDGLLRRFTSARAERTARLRPRTRRPAVHLRSRGEDSGEFPGLTGGLGSPPLARRGRTGKQCAALRQRFTSARAERTR